jgi:thiol-disulfide isomerase/thioredoxin
MRANSGRVVFDVVIKAAVVLFLIALLSAAQPAQAQEKLDGRWDAVVVVGQAEIPFRFEIAHQGDQWTGYFFEGEKKIGSTSGSFTSGKLEFNYEFLNSTLTATVDADNKLTGTYRVNRSNGKVYVFHAQRWTTPGKATEKPPGIAGDWEMKPVGDEQNANQGSRQALSWNLYLRQSGAEVSGSILRVDGDTGTLTGRWQGDSFVLSHFAGERPLLVEARLQPDGTLHMLLNKQREYLAARSSDAQAKGIPAPVDPSQYTHVKDASEPFHFRFADINGKIYSDSDSQFRNKVVLLAIGGTWCPNCRDEAPFFVDLYKRYHAQGLEVVGLNFEATGNPEEDKPRIVSFIKEFSVPYPILYAGATPEVKDKLPQIENFDSYPTSIYIGRDGRVARIHAGFASTATGEAHVALQHEVEELVQKLLRETPQR